MIAVWFVSELSSKPPLYIAVHCVQLSSQRRFLSAEWNLLHVPRTIWNYFAPVQNSQYHSATISLWPCIHSASSWSQHTLFTLCHSYQTTIIAQGHSPLLSTCFTSSVEPASYITQDSSSELFILLSATFVRTCSALYKSSDCWHWHCIIVVRRCRWRNPRVETQVLRWPTPVRHYGRLLYRKPQPSRLPISHIWKFRLRKPRTLPPQPKRRTATRMRSISMRRPQRTSRSGLVWTSLLYGFAKLLLLLSFISPQGQHEALKNIKHRKHRQNTNIAYGKA